MSKYYEIVPKKLGAVVIGIDLQKENRSEVIDDIRKDVTTYRMLFFSNQGIISGHRHVEISRWFGELQSTFTQHHRSPHPDVFRVSNDESEGLTGIGRTGWHIDGSFYQKPYAYSLYHMVSVPKTGATAFVPLTEIIERLDKEKRSRWDRLWMLSDRREGPINPLIYNHPITKKPVLCFHLGMTKGFIWDYRSPNEKIASDKENVEILKEIDDEITRKSADLIYRHEWQPGEFIISDNLAVGHEAAPETQCSKEDVGLRVLHRTTVKGVYKPQK